MQDFAGTDRISVRQRLGAGGFGVVYRGFDLERKIPIAIKTLKALDPGGLARFKEEFRALADIAHPNLISLFELMSDGDQWFFTMELVDGVDFLTWVRGEAGWDHDTSGQEASEAETTAVDDAEAALASDRVAPPLQGKAIDRLRHALRQLASGIDALHRAGTLHRDVKPSNVLVTPAGRVVLLDFGLAREMPTTDGATAPLESQVFGTPAYMAPERMRSGPAGPEADWYAVGVMLYEALTGRRPFDGSLLDQILAKQRSQVPRPRDVAPGAPADLDALCRELLSLDPSQRPAGAAILERLGSDAADRSAAPAPRARTFVGRERELAALDDAYETVRDGRAVMVSVGGGPGVGKSALVRHFVETLAARDGSAVVLAGRCYETESVPYKAVDSVLDALSKYLQQLPIDRAEALLPREVGALTRLFPVLGSVPAVARAPRRTTDVPDAQELRRRAFAALRELVGRLSDRHPLVVVIDDLQWGDMDSAALLAELLRPPDAPALLLLVTHRTAEAARAPMLQELTRVLGQMPAVDARELPLTELAPDEARALASLLLGSRGESSGDADTAVHVAGESAGNPLFIGELARHFKSARMEELASPGASLEQVIDARVRALPDAARRLLEIVAVAGQPIDVTAAFEATGDAVRDERLIAQLRSARLIRGSGDARWRRIEPYHDRIREVVSGRLPADVLRRTHLRVGEALEAAAGADPDRLAFHFERAGAIDRAIPHMLVAATHAAAGLAFNRAATLYQHVLDLRLPTDSAERARLRERLGTALATAGRGPKAAEAFLAAAADAAPDEALDLRRRAAHQYLTSGHIDQGLELLRVALKAVGLRMAPTPRRALLSLLYHRFRLKRRGFAFTRRALANVPAADLRRIETCWAAATGLANVDTIRAADFHIQYLRLVLDAGEPHRIARGLSNAVSQTALAGSVSRPTTEALRAKADALVQALADPYLIGHNDITCGIAEFLNGRWRPALARLTRAEAVLREQCTGVTWELDAVVLYLLRTAYMLGDIATVRARVFRLIDDAVERGDQLGTTILRARIAPTAHMAADNPAAARQACREGIAAWSQSGFHQEHYFEWMGQTEVDLYEGQGPAAWDRVNSKWRALQGSLITRVQVVRLQTLELRGRAATAAAVATADPAVREKLLRDAERDARAIEKEGVAWTTGMVHRLHASIAAGRGDTARARDLLLESERAHEVSEMMLHAMSARRRRGVLVGGDEGRALVESADAWATGQGIADPVRFLRVFGV